MDTAFNTLPSQESPLWLTASNPRQQMQSLPTPLGYISTDMLTGDLDGHLEVPAFGQETAVFRVVHYA
jgi:hypothetical protein